MVIWGWAALVVSAILWIVASRRAVAANPSHAVRNLRRARPLSNIALLVLGWVALFWGLLGVTRPDRQGDVPFWVGIVAVIAIVTCAALPLYIHNGRVEGRRREVRVIHLLFLAAAVLVVAAFVVEANANHMLSVVVALVIAAWIAATSATFLAVQRRRPGKAAQL